MIHLLLTPRKASSLTPGIIDITSEVAARACMRACMRLGREGEGERSNASSALQLPCLRKTRKGARCVCSNIQVSYCMHSQHQHSHFRHKASSRAQLNVSVVKYLAEWPHVDRLVNDVPNNQHPSPQQHPRSDVASPVHPPHKKGAMHLQCRKALHRSDSPSASPPPPPRGIPPHTPPRGKGC
jgi:hypothetical protein